MPPALVRVCCAMPWTHVGCGRLKSSAALLQQEHDRLKTVNAALEKDHAALRASYDDLRKKCADLEQELDRVKARNQTLEVSQHGIPCSAKPFLGR